MAQHALVLGSSGHVQPHPAEPAQSAQPVYSHSIRSLTEPLMVTGQPLLIVWKICPSMLVRMKISLVSWIASTETDPKAGGEPPPGTSPWFLHQLTRFISNQLQGCHWSGKSQGNSRSGKSQGILFWVREF